MAAKEEVSGQFTIDVPSVIIHPNLTPEALERRLKVFNEKTPRYSTEVLFDRKDEVLKQLVRTCAAVAAQAYPGVAREDMSWPIGKGEELAFPFFDGDDLADEKDEKAKKKGKPTGRHDFYRGKIVFRTSSPKEPQFSELKGNKWVETDPKRFYSGSYAVLQINFKDYGGVDKNPDGVKAYLNMIGFHSDGERIGGRDPNTTFSNVKGKETDHNPFEGDDEIAF